MADSVGMRDFKCLSAGFSFGWVILYAPVALATQPCPDGSERTGMIALPVTLVILAAGIAAAVVAWKKIKSSAIRWVLSPLLVIITLIVAVFAMGILLMVSPCVQ